MCAHQNNMNGKEVNIASVEKFITQLISENQITLDPYIVMTNSLGIARDGYVAGWTDFRQELLENGLLRLGEGEFHLSNGVIEALRKACDELGAIGDITFE